VSVKVIRWFSGSPKKNRKEKRKTFSSGDSQDETEEKQTVGRLLTAWKSKYIQRGLLPKKHSEDYEN